MPARVSRLSFTALLLIEGSAAICESGPVSIVVMPSPLTTCAGKRLLSHLYIELSILYDTLKDLLCFPANLVFKQSCQR